MDSPSAEQSVWEELKVEEGERFRTSPKLPVEMLAKIRTGSIGRFIHMVTKYFVYFLEMQVNLQQHFRLVAVYNDDKRKKNPRVIS